MPFPVKKGITFWARKTFRLNWQLLTHQSSYRKLTVNTAVWKCITVLTAHIYYCWDTWSWQMNTEHSAFQRAKPWKPFNKRLSPNPVNPQTALLNPAGCLTSTHALTIRSVLRIQHTPGFLFPLLYSLSRFQCQSFLDFKAPRKSKPVPKTAHPPELRFQAAKATSARWHGVLC